jgi:hypothetical protein
MDETTPTAPEPRPWSILEIIRAQAEAEQEADADRKAHAENQDRLRRRVMNCLAYRKAHADGLDLARLTLAGQLLSISGRTRGRKQGAADGADRLRLFTDLERLVRQVAERRGFAPFEESYGDAEPLQIALRVPGGRPLTDQEADAVIYALEALAAGKIDGLWTDRPELAPATPEPRAPLCAAGLCEEPAAPGSVYCDSCGTL